MLLSAVREANTDFEDMQLPIRFTEDLSGGDEVYDIYMAKKKNGKPKNDYPSK